MALGFSKNGNGYEISGEISKQKIRDLHSIHRSETLEKSRAFIDENSTELIRYFASGRNVEPTAIDPELVEVRTGSIEAKLFRLSCLLWSVPVSQGFGRRIRFLVRDRQNGCLIGLFALGDPVFNLSARDDWIDWDHTDRSDRLTHVMDAYVVGALPPYSHLIGGKLVAALMASDEVKRVYERKYLGREAIISGKSKRSRLALVTTTSALGRSSIYNRLSIPNGPRFERIGYTRGYGHFQFSGRIFELLRGYLEEVGHPYASGHQFGMGPNWRIRVVREALNQIGFDGKSLLKHGIGREVYAAPLAHNWREILQGEHKNLRSCVLPVSEIADYCITRWMIPRSERDKKYKRFPRKRILDALQNGGPGPQW